MIRTRLVVTTALIALLAAGCTANAGTANGGRADLVAPRPSSAAPRQPNAAITALLSSIDRAWNSGDAAAFASHWTTNGSVTSPQGTTTEGRDNIQREQAAGFAGPMKGTTHQLHASTIAWPTTDVAVVDGTAVISNLSAPDGSTYPPLSATFTCVCVRHGGTWLVSRMVSYTFMT
jgi:uncharacterized protein (TIGR02246 family)